LSRSWADFLWPAAVILPAAAAAQSDAEPDQRIARMIENARHAYSSPAQGYCDATQGDTNQGDGEEIVVCAPARGNRWRVPSTSASAPDSPAALNDGLPRAPWVSRLPDCRGGDCMGFGWAPPPVHMIDLKAIPEPPAGSDADRIAKGELAAP